MLVGRGGDQAVGRPLFASTPPWAFAKALLSLPFLGLMHLRTALLPFVSGRAALNDGGTGPRC
ncbi:hypothetical protein BANRA_05235 [Escherichia coli]|nr:hypothetical protein BANRA_05235 [Escherichia coli]